MFRIGEETKHVIETINKESIETSIFSEQYKRSLSSLNCLLSLTQKQSETNVDNTPNNILSFIGDRGSGKTSCMMSFAQLLEHGLNDFKLSYQNVTQRSFLCLDRIDPSFFDESHNVIELFLAELYNVFEEQRRKNYGKSDSNKDKQEKAVLDLFAQAQTMMFEMTKTEKDRYDVLDNLQNLSAGIRLWSAIGSLVKAFLEYMDKEKGILVLPIDDIDLNSKMAADMMEQIRKFLIQPNVIILFAVKIDQLELSKRLSLAKEYDIMFSHKLLSDTNVISEMAEAYITKLLPHQQRIYMPDGTAYFHQPVTIVLSDNNKELLKTYNSVRQMIPELIYKKTRYLFYNSTDRTSYIVPSNLRELRFLTGLLYNMKDYWQDADNHESNIYNKLLFCKYLYETWVANNLDDKMQESAHEIINTQDNAQVNAIVLAAIKRHFLGENQLLSKFITAHPEAEHIFNETNINYNIAIGDVLDIVDFLEESEKDTLKLKFLFFIRSFYSIRLHQAYKSIPDNNKVKTTKQGEMILSVKSSTRLSNMNLSEYDKLVAGYFINTRLSKIITPGRAEKDTRDARNINFKALLNLISKVKEEYDCNDVDNKDKTNRLCLVEFFMLGISRRFDTQNDNKSMQYRTAFPVFYAESLEHITKNAYFDVGALLYNLTRIENCYKRFKDGNAIYEIATQYKGSLLNRFYKQALQEKANKSKKNIPAYWNSYCCFRNAEIIKAFRTHAERADSSGSDHIDAMSKAFGHMGNFCISTYDKSSKSKYSEIKFTYLSYIEELLKTESIRQDFMNIFNEEIDTTDSKK